MRTYRGKTKTYIGAEIPLELKEAFTQYCDRRMVTQSIMIRQLILSALGRDTAPLEERDANAA
jgi:hypothetical protein